MQVQVQVKAQVEVQAKLSILSSKRGRQSMKQEDYFVLEEFRSPKTTVPTVPTYTMSLCNRQ